MSLKNFLPTVWNSAISTELERLCVFIENTNRQYEGEVKNLGDSVRILGVAKPTIYTTNSSEITLPTAEQIEDTAITMNINQIAYFNYMINDLDASQMAKGGIAKALNTETSEGLACEMDKFVANMSGDKLAVLDNKTAYQITKDNILEKIDNALTMLYKNDVNQSAKITLTVSPQFYMLLKQAYIRLDTDNSLMMTNGRVGKYGNVEVKMSNNVASKNGVELIQLKTDRAIAFCNPTVHTEAYRPENRFSNAVKGFVLYDGKIVRPKEMVVMNVKYTA